MAITTYDDTRSELHCLLAEDHVNPDTIATILSQLSFTGPGNTAAVEVVSKGTTAAPVPDILSPDGKQPKVLILESSGNTVDTDDFKNLKFIVQTDPATNHLDVTGHKNVTIVTADHTNNVVNLTGSTGNDIVYAGSGDNTVYGGAGSDSIYGGSGSDSLIGGSGNGQLIVGGSDCDTLSGGSGSYDTVIGGDGVHGHDSLSSGTGSHDSLIAGNGTDTLTAGTGVYNTLQAGGGNDSLLGGGSHDYLDGGAGNDTLNGGNGRDESIVGGTGDNTFYAGTGGGNTLVGGTGGSDTFYVPKAIGDNVTIVGGSGTETVDFAHKDNSFVHESTAGGITTIKFTDTAQTIKVSNVDPSNIHFGVTYP